MTNLLPAVQALVEREPSLAFVVDADLHYLAYNLRYADAVRHLYAVELSPGMALVASILRPEDRDKALTLLGRGLAGEAVVAEGPLGEGAPGREPAVFRTTVTPLGPSPGVLLVTATNLTHQRQAEAAAQRQAQLFSEALDTSDFAYWSYDGDTGETFFSRGYYAMLGYEPGAFAMGYEAWVSLIHPEDLLATTNAFRSFFQVTDSDFHLEYRMRTATGGWRWILGKGRVTERDERGLPRRVAGVNLDITQRRLMAQSLSESEARWTSLVDGAPVGIALLGPLGIVRFVNDRQARSEEPWSVGRSWKEFLPPFLHEALDEAVRLGFEQGEPTVFRSHRRQGVLGAFLEHHVGPVREDGRVVLLMVVTLDVTAHVRGEIRRTQAAARQRSLWEANEDTRLDRSALLRKALLGALSVTDSRASYLYYYLPSQKTFVLHACEGGAELWPVEGALADLEASHPGALAEAVSGAAPVVSPDLLVVPVFDAGQVVAVFAVTGKDLNYADEDASELAALTEGFWMIIQRREAEQSMLRLSQAVEHSPVALVITDPHGRIEYVNPKFSLLTGYPRGEVLGANIRLLQSGLTPREVYHDLWSTITAGRDWQGEMVNRRKDGTLYNVLLSISPVFGPVGEISHFISIKEDVTERKAAQELLARAGKLETIGTLAAGVAHDFNNLLTSVLGFNEMLLRKLAPDDGNRVYAEKIEYSGRRAANLVSSLLAVGRQQRLSKAVVDLGALLREEEPLLASLIKAPLRLVCELQTEGLCTEVDPGQVSQVVVNLVSNARDALGGRGTITLSVGGDESNVWFRVSDDGPGIPSELQDRVFDPFFTTKPIGQGTGLGLSIVQGIVHQHGGRIELKSNPGTGAAFTVVFPRSAA